MVDTSMEVSMTSSKVVDVGNNCYKEPTVPRPMSCAGRTRTMSLRLVSPELLDAANHFLLQPFGFVELLLEYNID